MTNTTPHSPGPWTASTDIVNSRRAIDAPLWDSLASVVVECEGLSDAKGEANCRLISAAPELLEALRGAMPYLERAQQEADYDVTPFSNAVAAIARAEGR